MIDKNMTLLSQNEVDSILDFLNYHSDGLSSDVMNQNSIDKLVKILAQAGINRKKQEEEGVNVAGCSLQYEIDPDSQFIELYAVNSEHNKVTRITPMNYLSGYISIEDDSRWGYSIAPDSFFRIAKIFKMTFDEATLQSICEIYALKNYGDAKYKIPALFLPEGDLEVD